ncbi:DMT family transporter [Leptothrix discophora]|uniref:DMT family transporter n=1 Tax=Leptothrix discophora TaxID=89 RepID=A0ABT9FYA4_LEPDI|nr:DMT family transporter [Leptothrix discophora]MDP4299215.1 DMT family transporter [Leptothrix discophora]
MNAVTGPGQRPWLGISLLLAATLCFAAMDNAVRHAGRFLPVLLILWLRYATQAGVMAIWLLRQGPDAMRTAHPRFQAARGALLLATSAFSFVAVQHMPVAEFTAINMLTPVLVTLLAAWLLKERVSVLRWSLVLGAFAGALIVMRPGSSLFGWAVLLPLGGAVTYASFQLLTSKLAALENPYTTHFYTGLVGTLLLLPVVLASPLDVDGLLLHASALTCALIALIGLLGTGGHLLLILALGCAPASRLVPFMYVQIANAALFGWLLFGDLPDRWGWIGMGVIAVCGGTTAWLNTRHRSGPPSALNDDPVDD